MSVDVPKRALPYSSQRDMGAEQDEYQALPTGLSPSAGCGAQRLVG